MREGEQIAIETGEFFFCQGFPAEADTVIGRAYRGGDRVQVGWLQQF